MKSCLTIIGALLFAAPVFGMNPQKSTKSQFYAPGFHGMVTKIVTQHKNGCVTDKRLYPDKSSMTIQTCPPAKSKKR